MDKKFNFYIAGFIAISSYIIILLAFFIQLQEKHATKYKTKTTQTVLEVDIVSFQKPDEVVHVNTQNTPKKIETIVEKTVSKTPTKTSDLKSLFANVSTKASKTIEKQHNNTKTSQTESRFKSKYEKEKKVKDVKLSKLVEIKDETLNKNNSKITQNSDNGEFDEYYSIINNLILTKWYNYPLLTESDYLVVVQITIDRQGKFSYHITSLSNVANVDEAIKLFLDNQGIETYPVSPDGKTKTIKVNFKPE